MTDAQNCHLEAFDMLVSRWQIRRDVKRPEVRVAELSETPKSK